MSSISQYLNLPVYLSVGIPVPPSYKNLAENVHQDIPEWKQILLYLIFFNMKSDKNVTIDPSLIYSTLSIK